MTCAQCYSLSGTEERRKKRGCISPSESVSYEVPFCPICNGNNTECNYCNGENRIKVYRCPVALSRSVQLSWIFSHYNDYNRFGTWPDGLGRYYQSTKLIQVYNTISSVKSHYESMVNNG